MALFKKKPPREVKEDDSLLVKLWYTPRTHAMMVMGIYIFIFALLIIIIRVSPKKVETKDRTLKSSKLKTMYSESIDNSDGFNLSIVDNDSTYYFSGSKIENEIKGTLLYNANTLKVTIADDICRVDIDEEPIDTRDSKKYVSNQDNEETPAITKCPENIDYRYFDINNVYNIISKLNGRYYGKDYYVYRIKNDEEVRLYVTDNIINKIEYKLKNSTYTYSIYKNEVVEISDNEV